MAIGPTLGGLLIRSAGWRSIFFVVVPVGIAACALALRALPESADRRGRSFDMGAQIAGAGALATLAFAAIAARRQPLLAGGALAASVLLFLVFIRLERLRGPSALVPLDMFRSRPFSGAMTATAAMTFGMYGVLFLVPLVWQATGRLGALGAGLALMPMALVFVATSPFSGRLAERIGERGASAGGVAVIGLGLVVIALGAASGSLPAEEAGLMLAGLGMGCATGPLMGIAVASVETGRAGTASSLINVARMAGATIGVAALGAVFAFAGEGVAGLRVAMLLGGAVQLAGGATAWVAGRYEAERGAHRRRVMCGTGGGASMVVPKSAIRWISRRRAGSTPRA
jgi:predicted MFS family arabinose efflux permease